MNRYIFTGLSPNTQKDDIMLAFRVLLEPGCWFAGTATEQVEAWFRNFLPVGCALTFATGRGALRAILSSLKLMPGDEILLQAYTCVSVPGAVLAAGGRPVYVDIEPDTLNMSPVDMTKKFSSKTRGVIIQHTFGSPADMEKLLKPARERNLFIIEDCAHTLGGKFHGQRLGTFGDAAIFSFGRDKTLSSVFGGVAVTNNIAYGKRLESFRQSNGQAGRRWVLRQLLQPIITSIAKSTYASGFGPLLLRCALALGLLSKAVQSGEKNGGWEVYADKTMPQALAILALHQLKKLSAYNAHRIELSKFYQKELSAWGVESHVNKGDADTALMRYTIFVQAGQKLREFAKSRRVFLGDWYAKALAPLGVDYPRLAFNPATCPVAEARAKMSVNLPLQMEVGKEQAEKIVDIVKKFLSGN